VFDKERFMKKVIVALVAASLSAGVMAAGDAAAGKNKVAACAGCHGMNGKAMVPNYPSLAGQNAAYLEGALKAYKTQERKGYQAAIMYGMAAALSDQDIADISAFYASQK
jgi:cytochrome c553